MLQDLVFKEINDHLKRSGLELDVRTRLADLGIDSLGAITILYELEDKLDIEVPNDIFDSLQTVGDILEQLELIISRQHTP